MERTKKVKKLKITFGITSAAVWVCTALFLAIYAISSVGTAAASSVDLGATGNQLMSFGVTAIIGIVAAIVIKDKLRTAIWMACTILASILFKEAGMYTILALWFIDEYVLFNLYKKYTNLYTINKEIDARE